VRVQDRSAVRETIQVGRFDLLAPHEADVGAAQVIGDDENDIGFSRWLRLIVSERWRWAVMGNNRGDDSLRQDVPSNKTHRGEQHRGLTADEGGNVAKTRD
jgi:hypothetical protein